MNAAAKSLVEGSALSAEELRKVHAYRRAANYLPVAQIYLLDNPLLQEPLTLEHVKPRLLGHWGTTPGLNFIYVHLGRVIRERDVEMLYVAGPRHGGPALAANTWLEGSYTDHYPNVSQDLEGMRELCRQFSFPGGIGSHVTREIPGSIHEGGELGYAISHALGAAFDSPDLIVACVVGDGEAETGPLAAAWHSNRFLNPTTDGAVLPILHLNGYRISSPTVLARIPREELESPFAGYGYRPCFIAGDDPQVMHQKMAATLDAALAEIGSIQQAARTQAHRSRPRWPMLVLETPKGWTGPKQIGGRMSEGHWRSHQVPFSDMATNPARPRDLETWLRSYVPEEIFSDAGVLDPTLAALAPMGIRRMGSNPHANGGLLTKDLRLPDCRDHAVTIPSPGALLLSRSLHPHRRLHLACLAAGPQRLFTPGPRIHRPRGQHEGRRHPRLPAAGCQHAALRDGPVPAIPHSRECDRRGQE